MNFLDELTILTEAHVKALGYTEAAAERAGIDAGIKFVELVQDRAGELLTWHDQRETVLRIANELYYLTTKMLQTKP